MATSDWRCLNQERNEQREPFPLIFFYFFFGGERGEANKNACAAAVRGRVPSHGAQRNRLSCALVRRRTLPRTASTALRSLISLGHDRSAASPPCRPSRLRSHARLRALLANVGVACRKPVRLRTPHPASVSHNGRMGAADGRFWGVRKTSGDEWLGELEPCSGRTLRSRVLILNAQSQAGTRCTNFRRLERRCRLNAQRRQA